MRHARFRIDNGIIRCIYECGAMVAFFFGFFHLEFPLNHELVTAGDFLKNLFGMWKGKKRKSRFYLGYKKKEETEKELKEKQEKEQVC